MACYLYHIGVQDVPSPQSEPERKVNWRSGEKAPQYESERKFDWRGGDKAPPQLQTCFLYFAEWRKHRQIGGGKMGGIAEEVGKMGGIAQTGGGKMGGIAPADRTMQAAVRPVNAVRTVNAG